MRAAVAKMFIAGQSWSEYWAQRLFFWFAERSSLVFTDTYSSDVATVIPAAGKFDADNYCSRVVANFGSDITDVTGGYIEVRFYYNGTSTPLVFLGSGDNSTAIKHFYVGVAAGKPRIKIANQTPAITNTYIADNAITAGWHTIRFISSGAKYSIMVDGATVAGTVTGTDNGKWIGNALDRDNLSAGIMLYNNTSYASQEHYIDYIDFNGTSKWYFTGQGKYAYDVLGGYHLTWVGTGYQKYFANAGQHVINTGFSVYTKSGEIDEIVPYASPGTPYNAAAFLSGYAKLADYAGATDGIIKGYAPPCLIGFNEAGNEDEKFEIFDRSNTTRQEDISRTSDYYDATSLATKSRYHSSECLYICNLMALFKVGYKNRIFPVNDSLESPTKVTGFMVSKTDLT